MDYSGNDYMAYDRGRFVIHYKDGTTYIENRQNDNAWDNRPLKPIKAIGIQPDAKIYINQITTDPLTRKQKKEQITINLESNDPNVKYIMEEIVLKGSFKFDYGFFIDKAADKGMFNGKLVTWGIRLGVVVDNQGHCFCLEYVGTGSPRGYYTTVHSLGMDTNSLEKNYNIYLEKLPNPHENIYPFPEINPLILEERRIELLKKGSSKFGNQKSS